MLLPSTSLGRQPHGHGARRLMDALLPGERSLRRPSEPREGPAAPGEGGWSDRERLRKLDFESMSAAEYRAAQRCVSALEPLLALDRLTLDPQTVDDTLGVLLKYQDDLARVRGSEAARLLESIAAATAKAG